jgi:hypothetical protein
MAKEDPSRIVGEVAGSVFASAAYSDADPMATAPRSSSIYNGRNPNINPFDPTTPANNPAPLAGNENYDELGQPVDPTP